jgi:hypothetical protein
MKKTSENLFDFGNHGSGYAKAMKDFLENQAKASITRVELVTKEIQRIEKRFEEITALSQAEMAEKQI